MTPVPSKRGLFLGGFLAEKTIDSCLRVTDEEGFLFRPALAFGGFRFLGHESYYLRCSWYGECLVPQPGFGPGRPCGVTRVQAAPVCLFSTGGPIARDVGTGSPLRCAVPTFAGSSCATPKSSSCDPSSNGLERNVVWIFPAIKDVASSFLSFALNLWGRLISKPSQNLVNRRHRRGQRSHVEALFDKFVVYVLGRHPLFRFLQNPPNRVCDSQTSYVFVGRNTGQWGKVGKNLVEMNELGFYFTEFRFQSRTLPDKLHLLEEEVLPGFIVSGFFSRRFHNQGDYTCQ